MGGEVAELKRRFRKLKRLRRVADRRKWVDELPAADVNRVCSCIGKIVKEPDKYLTPRTKTSLRRRRKLLYAASEPGVERRRQSLKRMVKVKSAKGGFFLAGIVNYPLYYLIFRLGTHTHTPVC